MALQRNGTTLSINAHNSFSDGVTLGDHQVRVWRQSSNGAVRVSIGDSPSSWTVDTSTTLRVAGGIQILSSGLPGSDSGLSFGRNGTSGLFSEFPGTPSPLEPLSSSSRKKNPVLSCLLFSSLVPCTVSCVSFLCCFPVSGVALICVVPTDAMSLGLFVDNVCKLWVSASSPIELLDSVLLSGNISVFGGTINLGTDANVALAASSDQTTLFVNAENSFSHGVVVLGASVVMQDGSGTPLLQMLSPSSSPTNRTSVIVGSATVDPSSGTFRSTGSVRAAQGTPVPHATSADQFDSGFAFENWSTTGLFAASPQNLSLHLHGEHPAFSLDPTVATFPRANLRVGGRSLSLGPDLHIALRVSTGNTTSMMEGSQLQVDPQDSFLEGVVFGNRSLTVFRDPVFPQEVAHVTIGSVEEAAGSLRVQGAVHAALGFPAPTNRSLAMLNPQPPLPLLPASWHEPAPLFQDPTQAALGAGFAFAGRNSTGLFSNGTALGLFVEGDLQMVLSQGYDAIIPGGLFVAGGLTISGPLTTLIDSLSLGRPSKTVIEVNNTVGTPDRILINPLNLYTEGVLFGDDQALLFRNATTRQVHMVVGSDVASPSGTFRSAGSVRSARGFPAFGSLSDTGFAFDDFADTGFFAANSSGLPIRHPPHFGEHVYHPLSPRCCLSLSLFCFSDVYYLANVSCGS